MTDKQKHREESRKDASQQGARKGGQGHHRSNEFRNDRGGHGGSGDAREQVDQEEFDRGGGEHRDGNSRNQARKTIQQ